MVTPVKNQRCQPPAVARKLKAAPRLYMSTRLKKDVTSTVSPSVKARTIHALVAMSSTTTAALTPSQRNQPRRALRMTALLVAPRERRGAARADPGMRAVGSDILAVVPAALALRVRARRDLDRHRIAAGLGERRLRGDEHEAQVVAERGELLVVGARRLQGDLGLQRRADRAGRARLLELLRDRRADLANAFPLGRELGFARLRRQHVLPRMQENAVRRLARAGR